jgi:hypothetical protein
MACSSVNFTFCGLDDWGMFVSFLFGTMSMSCAHHGLQAYYFEVLPISRMQGVVSFTPSLSLPDLARPIESTVFPFVLPQTEANALDASGTQRGPECKSVFLVHPQRNNQNSDVRNTRVLFLLCNYIYIVSNPISSASSADRDSCLVLHPLR